MKSVNVLLLDGQTIQSLAVSKSLKAAGYGVFSICNSKLSYGYWDRNSYKKFYYPSLDYGSQEFKAFLINLLKEYSIDVIIPMNDNSASFLSNNKIELKSFAKFLIPDKEIFYKGYDKKELMTFCEINNFPHPKTADLTKYDIKSAVDKVGFPCLIKPNITTGARGITRIDDIDSLHEKLPSILNDFGDCHLQQFIPEGGKQFKVQLFIDYNQETKNSSVLEKKRYYPVKGGSSCCNMSITSEYMVEVCSEVLKKIGWIGFADFDLIQNPNTNEVSIIEINPRVPACIRSSIISGIDFPKIIVKTTLGEEIKTYNYQPFYSLRYFAFDLLWLLKSENRFNKDEKWFDFFGSKVFYQDFYPDNILSFIAGTLGGLTKLFNKDLAKSKSGIN